LPCRGLHRVAESPMTASLLQNKQSWRPKQRDHRSVTVYSWKSPSVTSTILLITYTKPD
jgi:hypothetical protein